MPMQQHPLAPETGASTEIGALRTVGVDLERWDGTAWSKLTAYAAVRLAASRTISFTGDMTGSGATTWNADLSIATTVDPNGHLHRRPFFMFGGDGIAVGNGGWTGLNVTWNAHDPHGCQSGQSAVARVAGWWYIGYQVYFADQTAGQALAAMWSWDPNYDYASKGASDGAGRWGRQSGGLQYSDGGRSAQVVAWQNSGGNRNVSEWYQFGIWIC